MMKAGPTVSLMEVARATIFKQIFWAVIIRSNNKPESMEQNTL